MVIPLRLPIRCRVTSYFTQLGPDWFQGEGNFFPQDPRLRPQRTPLLNAVAIDCQMAGATDSQTVLVTIEDHGLVKLRNRHVSLRPRTEHERLRHQQDA